MTALCPLCGKRTTYVGLGTVECDTVPECANYREPEGKRHTVSLAENQSALEVLDLAALYGIWP